MENVIIYTDGACSETQDQEGGVQYYFIKKIERKFQEEKRYN